MKAEEKIVAFMFFSVVMQFVYSLGGGGGDRNNNNNKKKKKNRIWEVGEGDGEGQEKRDRRAKF